MTSARKLKRRVSAQIARHLLCSIALDVQAEVVEVCVFEGRRTATLRLSFAKAGAFVAFPVLPVATPNAERQAEVEHALKAFGIVPAEAV